MLVARHQVLRDGEISLHFNLDKITLGIHRNYTSRGHASGGGAMGRQRSLQKSKNRLNLFESSQSRGVLVVSPRPSSST